MKYLCCAFLAVVIATELASATPVSSWSSIFDTDKNPPAKEHSSHEDSHEQNGTERYRSGEPCSSCQFRCDNGQCIIHDLVCDGENDCGDNSDEQFCTKHYPSPLIAFTGCQSPRSVPLSYVCDGVDHCRDGFRSDEAGCPGESTTSRTSPPGRSEDLQQVLNDLARRVAQQHLPVEKVKVFLHKPAPIYVGSKVSRGPEWEFGFEDGSPPGVGIVKGISNNKYIVQWESTGEFALYDVFKGYITPILHGTELQPGDEVVRGPGWTHLNEDGGSGKVGHVIERAEAHLVKVRWATTGKEEWYLGNTFNTFDVLRVRKNVGIPTTTLPPPIPDDDDELAIDSEEVTPTVPAAETGATDDVTTASGEVTPTVTLIDANDLDNVQDDEYQADEAD